MMWNIIIGGIFFLLLLAAVQQFLRWWSQNKCSPICEAEDPCVCVEAVDNRQVCEKDSIIEQRLNVLTQKLAKKESKLKESQSKVQQKKSEIKNLPPFSHIDKELQQKYQEVLDGMKETLKANEKDCKQLQKQIEWVSRRRTELKDEVVRGQNMYSQAVVKLAHGLRDIQKTARPSDALDDDETETNCALPPLTGTGSELWAAFEKRPEKVMLQDCCKKTETVGTTPRAPAYYY